MRRKLGRPKGSKNKNYMPFEWQTVFPALMVYHGLADEQGIAREHLMRWVLERLGGDPEQLMLPKAYLVTVKRTLKAAPGQMKNLASFKRGRGRPRKAPVIDEQVEHVEQVEQVEQVPSMDESVEIAEALDDALV
jgi:hypothetical protein